MSALEQARENMLERQIRTWDVLDERVLAAMAAIPRERFVPAGWEALAYADMAIPLPHGQAMMEPKVEARLLQAAMVRPTDRILEIGTGSGYMTALLARLGGSVTSVERIEAFIPTAGEKLQAHGLGNVHLVTGNGRDWLKGPERFDVVVVTGSLPDASLLSGAVLEEDGRLVVVVGQDPVMEAMLFTREGPVGLCRESLFDTWVAPLQDIETRPVFQF
jgi:protein-L-isoaspartate(D-aspartate) O-methyltransferase